MIHQVGRACNFIHVLAHNFKLNSKIQIKEKYFFLRRMRNSSSKCMPSDIYLICCLLTDSLMRNSSKTDKMCRIQKKRLKTNSSKHTRITGEQKEYIKKNVSNLREKLSLPEKCINSSYRHYPTILIHNISRNQNQKK